MKASTELKMRIERLAIAWAASDREFVGSTKAKILLADLSIKEEDIDKSIDELRSEYGYAVWW